MKYQIFNYWDLIDSYKLCNNIILISQGKVKPSQALYNSIQNELVKCYMKQVLNIR